MTRFRFGDANVFFNSWNVTEIEAVARCTFACTCDAVFCIFSCVQSKFQPFYLRQLLKVHPFDLLIEIYLLTEGTNYYRSDVFLATSQSSPSFSGDQFPMTRHLFFCELRPSVFTVTHHVFSSCGLPLTFLVILLIFFCQKFVPYPGFLWTIIIISWAWQKFKMVTRFWWLGTRFSVNRGLLPVTQFFYPCPCSSSLHAVVPIFMYYIS